jgi:hypothetical protein
VKSRTPGKRIGGRVYVHRDYAHLHCPQSTLRLALGHAAYLYPVVTSYTTVRLAPGEIAFQFSPDFNSAPEPRVGWTISVREDGTVRRTDGGADPMIWHHKWQWVGDDYRGFSVAASKRRSQLWKPHVRTNELSKIGRRSYWERIKHRWSAK